MKRCYLAGPMRGYPEFNFPAFFAAAKSLRERGFEVWSPAENDVHQDGFDPAKDSAQPMRHYMKRDLPAVLDADFVAVLPGWEKSQGACLEVHVARTCGIPVHDAATLAPVLNGQGYVPSASDWRPMVSAPLDGTEIELLMRHFTYWTALKVNGKEEAEKLWQAVVRGRWIDHNGGGWTWHGMAGSPVGWRPLHACESSAAEASGK